MKTIPLKCAHCEKEFNKYIGEYNRQIKKGNSNFYCSFACSGAAKTAKFFREQETRRCVACNKEFSYDPKEVGRIYCSQQCSAPANSRSSAHKRAESLRERYKLHPELKPKIKGKVKNGDYLPRDKGCEICGTVFLAKSKKAKTCSKVCYIKLMSINSKSNPNCGGETNFKKYSYKGITMDSSWEVELAEFLDNNGIVWTRSRKLCLMYIDEDGCKRRYYPDFYLPEYDIYLDPKNKYLQEKDESKLQKVRAQHDITLWSGFLNKIKENLESLRLIGEARNYCI